MSNRTLAVKLEIQTLADAVATLVYRLIPISSGSYERFGDKNRMTPGLRKMWLAPVGKGRSLDLIAQDIKAYEQFSFLEEDFVIGAIIDFTESHDSSKSLETYLRTRLTEQQQERTAIERKLSKVAVDSEDIQCFVDHALAILPKPELQKEAQDFIKSPNLYFGPLLDVERCKEDLFDLPDDQQIKVVESILIATKNRPAYPMRSKPRKAKVTSLKKALGRKKPAPKKAASPYVDPDEAPIYYLKNRETQKLEIHSSQLQWQKLDVQQQTFIKRHCLFSRPKGAWISKATYDRATYLKSQLKEYGIPEAAPIGERTSYEERFDLKRERAENRSDRYAVKADKTRDEAYRSQNKAVDMLRVIPMGQPILVGHHSERGHRRLIQKSDDAMRRGVQGEKKADYYDQRAVSAQITADASQLKDKGYLMRRIKENQKTINTYQKKWKPGTFETRDGYLDAVEKLAFYQRKLAELAASGVVVVSKEVLKKAGATAVKFWDGWREIVRINEKSVTVTTGYSWTRTVPYDEIKDWRPKAEEKPAEKKPTKTPRKTKVSRLKKAVKKKPATPKLAMNSNGEYVALVPKKKSTAKAKAGRKASATVKKIKAVKVARTAKRKAVAAKVVKPAPKKATKPAQLKKQREAAAGKLKSKMSPVAVIKTGRQFNETYRSTRSQLMDNPHTHKKVLAPTAENLKKWAGKPGKYDLVGVDTGSQNVTIRKKKEGELDKTTKQFLKKS
ncbi:hypothetical protein BWI97_14205 [Siphonobacter sp. BAB-5405]|uniref:DUF3560 domain-containing protein n=1 Tax=Siphonobacter sp. BAB-5405 TaxID=1864825 RepID=UPI000C804344|nr:DUF3560 domain-containing protein [Siphonobacter sp. BAB-5405]PMD95504.1 hypothetical protein BWI97_14205 [Siphonobacter sp. BAB-5405]